METAFPLEIGPLTIQKEDYASRNPCTQRPLSVRRRKEDLVRRVNAPLALDVTADQLTSSAGLEIIGGYLRRLDFSPRARRHLRPLGLHRVFPAGSVVRLLLAMLLVGARRLRHVGYLDGPDRRASVSWLQSASPRGPELLPDHGASGPDRTRDRSEEPCRQRPRRQDRAELCAGCLL